MEAYYHNQATMPHFSGHFRQRGSGFVALAMGIGRVSSEIYIPFSFFSECTMSLNGEKISTTNANFALRSFIETEFSHGNDAKKTWLAFQGYFHEHNPSGIDWANGRPEDVAEHK